MKPILTLSCIGIIAWFAACGNENEPQNPLTNDLAHPATSQIAFVSARDGNFELYLINADGSNTTRLTNDPAIDFAPAWSPDGSKIAFESTRGGNSEIYIMRADGSQPTNLTRHPAADHAPTWSPDGTQIAFSRHEPEGLAYKDDSDLYIMASDRSRPPVQLEKLSKIDESPTWAPHGDQIAFVAADRINAGITRQIGVVNTDGSHFRYLIRSKQRVENNFPAWSPDGTKIAFSSNRDGNLELYIMQADGSNPIRLTNHLAADESPTWSPDGKKIAFASSRDGNFEIYVMQTDSENLVRLTHNEAVDRHPAWRP